jgi:hypothetical protein
MRVEILLLALSLGGLVLVLLSAVLIGRQAIRVLRGLFEVPVYRPLVAEELPETARFFFDDRTAQLGRLGFRCCGDYRLRRELEHFARLFLDASGTIGCELAYVRFWPWKCWRITSLFSMLENLDCVETGDLAVPPHDGQLVLRTMAAAGAEQLLDAHRALVAQLEAEREAPPVAMDADSVALVALYLGALMHESLHASGVSGQNRYASTLPEIRRTIRRLVRDPVNQT